MQPMKSPKHEPAPPHRVNIHPTAVVHPTARLERDVEIGPYCLVGEHVRLGERTSLLANVIVNGWTDIGKDCEIHPFSVIGGTSQDKKFRGERSYVRIGERNTIREYVTIHRGTGEESETVIGDDNLILAYGHIAHNCQLGSGIVISNNSQLAGHVVVGDYANIGGMVGVHQFVRIGRMAMVGGMARIVKDIMPFMIVEGNPSSVRGLNKVGLKRRNVSEESIAELEEAYTALFQSSLNLAAALDSLRERLKRPESKELIAFLEVKSDRGILKR